ncbi:MAG: 2-amino-4-hydroxy-6-hydroxymethyldihydropteridine diphosphokinase [Tannerellaceae bacterium]|nr:2-amino-4-hydroxy-6-hydroxymethyldihydropteridine diphosphokinase [Tannerellaceae bacterium]
MATVYLGLGTNLGNKQENLNVALQQIEKQIGKPFSLSAFYETAPWGFHSENTFLNAVVGVETSLSPFRLLQITQQIEKESGRKLKSVAGSYEDRIIDIDLLLVGDMTVNTSELSLPHPFMTERLFVMEPLAEIAPDLVHPVLKIPMKEILIQLKLKKQV